MFSGTLLHNVQKTIAFWPKLLDNVVKTAFSVSIGILSGIKSLKKKFQSFSEMVQKKLSVPWQNFFGQVVKPAFPVSKEIVWEIVFFRGNEIYLKVSWRWMKNFRPLARKFFSVGISTLRPRCLSGMFEEIFFRILPLQYPAMDLERKNPDSCQKFFGKFVESAFYMSIGTF